MLNLHVIFAIDRAGLVGEDGETHHGIYDVGFLRHAPGLTILCPASGQELKEMLHWAANEQSGPVAIRYPRGGDSAAVSGWNEKQPVVCHRTGNVVTLITYGNLLDNTLTAAGLLAAAGVEACVLRLTRVQPLPVDEILALSNGANDFVVVEEVSGNCGIRDALAYQISNRGDHFRVSGIDLGERFICHGSVAAVREHCGLAPQAIADHVREVLKSEN